MPGAGKAPRPGRAVARPPGTGPGGKTVTREATVTRNGNSWERDVKVTGPNGGTWTREGQGTCSGGNCTFGGTVTGPRGNTGTYTGTSGPSP